MLTPSSTSSSSEHPMTSILLHSFGFENIPKSQDEFLKKLRECDIDNVGRFLYSFLIEPSCSDYQESTRLEESTISLNADVKECKTELEQFSSIEKDLENRLLADGFLDNRTLRKLKEGGFDCHCLMPYIKRLDLDDENSKRRFIKLLFVTLSRKYSYKERLEKLNEFFLFENTENNTTIDTTKTSFMNSELSSNNGSMLVKDFQKDSITYQQVFNQPLILQSNSFNSSMQNNPSISENFQGANEQMNEDSTIQGDNGTNQNMPVLRYMPISVGSFPTQFYQLKSHGPLPSHPPNAGWGISQNFNNFTHQQSLPDSENQALFKK